MLATIRTLAAVLIAALPLLAAAAERCSAVGANLLRCGREVVVVEGIDPNGGAQARQRLQERLRAGEIVIERRGRDRHGRTLGRLYVGGKRITQVDLAAKPRPKR